MTRTPLLTRLLLWTAVAVLTLVTLFVHERNRSVHHAALAVEQVIGIPGTYPIRDMASRTDNLPKNEPASLSLPTAPSAFAMGSALAGMLFFRRRSVR